MTKTCGECKHFFLNTEGYCKSNDGFEDAHNDACTFFKPKSITNGDKIIAGGMRALAEFQQSCSCDTCAYFDNGNPFRVRCGRPHDKTCTDGIIAYLNAPAESEVKDE